MLTYFSSLLITLVLLLLISDVTTIAAAVITVPLLLLLLLLQVCKSDYLSGLHSAAVLSDWRTDWPASDDHICHICIHLG
jgi:hypothetical protein